MNGTKIFIQNLLGLVYITDTELVVEVRRSWKTLAFNQKKDFLVKNNYGCQVMFMSFIFLGIGRKTAYDLDFMFATILKIYHHNSTFEYLAAKFNDFHCDGIYYP